jgi:pSer/pThr/pTyr-binding forkhead associated (FHA) protein
MDQTVIKPGDNLPEGLPTGLHIQLAFAAGPERGMVKRLWKQTTTIGRAADIAINDPAASKVHASLSWENGSLILRDLDSTNGTSLSGGRVWEAVVGNLDEITIGETVIQVAILQESAGDGSEGQAVVESDDCGDTTLPRPTISSPADEALPAGVRSVIQVVAGPDAGERFPLDRRITIIGRTGADIVLKDLNVSRRHATIEFMGHDRVFVKDLESRNGTMLNRKRISVAPIKNGDSLQVGSTVLNFFVSFTAPQNK